MISRETLAAVLLVLSLGLPTSCQKKSNKRSKVGVTKTTVELIDKESVSFQRKSDRRSGTLRFKGKVAVNCAIRFWNDDTKTAPTDADCTQKGATDIEQVITDLEELKPYTLKVFVWDAKEEKDTSKFFVVQEENIEQPNPTDPPIVQYKVKDVTVARMIMPQSTTEIYRHTLDTPRTVAEIRSILSPKETCAEGDPPATNQFGQEKALDIKNISSDGFAKSNAASHPSAPNRVIQNFDFLQTQINWEWAFIFNNKNYQFTSRPPAYLKSIFVKGDEEIKLGREARDLSADPQEIKANANAGITLTWDTRHRTSTSHVRVSIKGEGKSLYCVYSSGSGTGKIPPDLFKTLPNGPLDLTVTFESHQIFLRKNTDFPPWLISSHDWRFAQIIKI